jgi:formylglycine-generating enzyme required for sulfatase activity
MKKTLILAFLPLWLTFSSQLALANPVSCESLFLDQHRSATVVALAKSDAKITFEKELSNQASSKIAVIPEFEYIREQAEKMGLRVWLFGGTASSYLHYVKWNLAREKGLKDLQADRFDFDFTNIFRSTQDLDIVIDASEAKAREFQNLIASKFPHFLGSKAAKWEVRTLRTRMGRPGELGFKEALLGDEDFNNQNTDSNSLGMVEITRSTEPAIRDLRHWDSLKSPFLEDTLNDRISFFRSAKHFTTSRAKAGQNPEILSVTRLLVKAFQYELKFSDTDFKQMKEIVDQFDPKKMTDQNAIRRLNDTAKKLVMHATNIEYAMNKLDELGLRKKLIAMGNKDEMNSSAWWLNKEPLRSKVVGLGAGKTARELKIEVVAHETNSFLAYESITRSHSGEPNVLISRQNAAGEAAAYGNGFYTQIGKVGARGTGLTIRFTVDPSAREGVDFTHHGNYVVFQNKKALKVIQESLNFGLDDLMKMAESDQAVEVDQSDLALLEKLKRKLNAAKISDELEKLLSSRTDKDHARLVHILSAFQNSAASKLVSSDTLSAVVKNVYSRIEPLATAAQESERIRYIQTVGPILKTLEAQGLTRSQTFFEYLDRLAGAPGATLEIRKLVAFEKLLASDNFETGLDFKKLFSKEELTPVLNEIKAWQVSADVRQRKFATGLNQKWSEAIEKGETRRLEALTESGLFDVNYKNVSGDSTLLLADYFNQRAVIDWLIVNRTFDFNAKNKRGFNQVEQLRLLGKNEMADKILRDRPDISARDFRVKERNDDGTPIMGFVKIDPKPFLMGDGKDKVMVTLTKPFEMLSTQTTQKTWREVVQLIQAKLPATALGGLKEAPSNFKGDTLPVEQVSFDDISVWSKALNQLSQMDDVQVQASLRAIFPGHRKGAIYRLPSEAEREFVQRNQGLAEGNFSFGNAETDLRDSAWFSSNSGNRTQPVGQKKPIMVNGRPIYDIQGNVWEWVGDWYGQKLSGGTDPTGPSTGSHRVIRGGSWNFNAQFLRAGYRGGYLPGYRYQDVGFRLARTAP